MSNQILVERIKELARTKQVSPSKAFAESGVGKNFISNMKTSNPSIGKITMLANYFGVSVDYLLGKTDQKESVSTVDKEAASPSPAQESSAPELSEQEQQLVNIFRAASPEARIEMIAAMVHVRDRHKKTYTVYRAAHSVDNAPHRLELRSAAEIEKLQNAPTVKSDDEL